MFLLLLLIHHNHVQYSSLHCIYHIMCTTLYVSCSAKLDNRLWDDCVNRVIISQSTSKTIRKDLENSHATNAKPVKQRSELSSDLRWEKTSAHMTRLDSYRICSVVVAGTNRRHRRGPWRNARSNSPSPIWLARPTRSYAQKGVGSLANESA
jgi:hypothetical protein